MISRLALIALAGVALPLAAEAGDYLGTLRLPKYGMASPPGTLSFESESFTSVSPVRVADSGFRLRLGYKYSRYLSVESEFVDFARAPGAAFSTPDSFASPFRSTGFGVDTVATIPAWRSFSFYGRLGAYHGEARNAFSAYSTSLLADPASRATRWRYGLGVRYDFTKAFGVHAELERYSPLGTPLAGEPEAESVSVGFAWRF